MIPDILRNAVRRFPDRPAVVAGERSLTFAQLDERSERLAGAFRGAGLGRGDRVGLLAANELEYLEVQVAAMRAGLVLVPLNYRLTVPELRFIFEDCRFRLLIHGSEHAEAAAAIGAELTWAFGPERYEAELAAHPPGTVHTTVLDPSLPCSILYTSGTTGAPKGAVATNRAYWARVNSFGTTMGVRSDDVFLQPLPIFHVAANICHAFLARGATCVLMRQFDAGELIDGFERHGVTRTFLVPTMVQRLLERPDVDRLNHTRMRQIMYGAAPISPTLQAEISKKLRCELWQGFGMTEAGLICGLQPEDHVPPAPPERLRSVGQEAWATEVAVDAEPGRIGEILVRGEVLMDGYWNRPEATAEALVDGWLHTGDVGYADADGFIYLTDRRSDMILTGGENVYPREVEDVLGRHPGVAAVAVLGLPDAAWGERVHAVIVAADAGAPPSADELAAFCRASLAAYKVPKSWSWAGELPLTATGKVRKAELKASLAAT